MSDFDTHAVSLECTFRELDEIVGDISETANDNIMMDQIMEFYDMCARSGNADRKVLTIIVKD